MKNTVTVGPDKPMIHRQRLFFELVSSHQQGIRTVAAYMCNARAAKEPLYRCPITQFMK